MARNGHRSPPRVRPAAAACCSRAETVRPSALAPHTASNPGGKAVGAPVTGSVCTQKRGRLDAQHAVDVQLRACAPPSAVRRHCTTCARSPPRGAGASVDAQPQPAQDPQAHARCPRWPRRCRRRPARCARTRRAAPVASGRTSASPTCESPKRRDRPSARQASLPFVTTTPPEGFRQHRFTPPPGVHDRARRPARRVGAGSPRSPVRARATGTAIRELDPVGVEQASCLPTGCSTRPIAAIYVTTLRRTHQTAAPLAARLGLTPTRRARPARGVPRRMGRRRVPDPCDGRRPDLRADLHRGTLGRDPGCGTARRLRRARVAAASSVSSPRTRPARRGRVARRRDRSTASPVTGARRFAFSGADNASISEVVAAAIASSCVATTTSRTLPAQARTPAFRSRRPAGGHGAVARAALRPSATRLTGFCGCSPRR